MSTFIQRQFAGWIAPGTDTDPVTYPPSTRVWETRDVYPSSILKIEDGLQISFETTLATLGSLVLPLPQLYDSANRLFVLIRSNLLVKLVTIHPVLGTSSSLLRPGADTDQNGFQSFVGRVTSITLTNPSATTATIQYMAYEYPDLTLSASWQNSFQTPGIIDNQDA